MSKIVHIKPQTNVAKRDEASLETQLPWFKFYVGDTLTRTQDMNAAELGAYFSLLMFHWNHCRLPAASDLPRVARVDEKTWRSMNKKVLSRVREDVALLDDQKKKAKVKSTKAQAAAKARWDANGYANAYANASFSHVPHDAF